jgi:hypothetical protein
MTVHIHYPRIWNAVQIWSVGITVTKAQVYFVFEHKNFFQGTVIDLISSKQALNVLLC